MYIWSGLSPGAERELDLFGRGVAFLLQRVRDRVIFIDRIVCVCMSCVQVSHYPPIVVDLFIDIFFFFCLCLFLFHLALTFGPIAHSPFLLFPFFFLFSVHSTATVDRHRYLSASYFVSFLSFSSRLFSSHSPFLRLRWLDSVLPSLFFLSPHTLSKLRHLDRQCSCSLNSPTLFLLLLFPPSFTLTLLLHSKKPPFLKLSLLISCLALSHPQQPIPPPQPTQRIKAWSPFSQRQ